VTVGTSVGTTIHNEYQRIHLVDPFVLVGGFERVPPGPMQ
jgi:hypothetical protein